MENRKFVLCFFWTVFVFIYWVKNVYACPRTKEWFRSPLTVIHTETGLDDTAVFNPRSSQNYSRGNNVPSNSEKVSIKKFRGFSSENGKISFLNLNRFEYTKILQLIIHALQHLIFIYRDRLWFGLFVRDPCKTHMVCFD